MILHALVLLFAQEPLAPEETVRKLKVPDGFSIKLFAGEPDLTQPISFCIDDRGRLWVAENHSYPHLVPKDRIVIFEDADGDGRFDVRKVFCEGLAYVTGLEVGFGGAWVIAPPQMLFIADRDGDDRADGPPHALLDGFGMQGIHNIANGFTWGPDGWLYAGHGRTSISEIGKPGTPKEQRVHYDGGVWRYHPVRHVFEPFCDGTTNPWGVAFDDHGQAIISTCVERHLYHAVQGAHFEPWRGRPSSRYAYRRIDSIADHNHWKGALDRESRSGSAEQLAAGGGHAHCGAMVYLGDSFPESYRGTVFMNNLHGHRVNNDILRRRGSSFVATHGPDFLTSEDRMHMGLHLQYGPDGSVYVSDWYDRGECHTRKPHETTGRIYKVVYKDTPSKKVDVSKYNDDELAGVQRHPNAWYATHARRVLQERRQGRAIKEGSRLHLLDLLQNSASDVTRRLRALWALHVIGATDDALLLRQLGSAEEYVRAWAIQLDLEDGKASAEAMARFAEMARTDPSPVVRLYLAAGMRRLPAVERWDVLEALAAHAEDTEDLNLPLMIWYAVEPMAVAAPERAVEFLKKARIPLLREFMARRIAAAQR